MPSSFAFNKPSSTRFRSVDFERFIFTIFHTKTLGRLFSFFRSEWIQDEQKTFFHKECAQIKPDSSFGSSLFHFSTVCIFFSLISKKYSIRKSIRSLRLTHLRRARWIHFLRQQIIITIIAIKITPPTEPRTISHVWRLAVKSSEQ